MMFSAGRSRRISNVPMIQSFAQFEKTYGKEGSSIIIDNCQDILFGGFVAAGDDNVVYFEAQAGAVVVKFRAEVGEFAADEVGLNGNDDGRQHKNNPQQKQVSG